VSRLSEDLRARVRTIPDWPQSGVQFRDITPLLQDAKSFRDVISAFAERYRPPGVELVAGIDARGFIVGSALALELGVGFVPVRKRGKLPYDTLAEDYTLEYGRQTLEIHADAAQAGQGVLLVDDLVATGGTMLAAARLLSRLGARVVEAAAVIDLPQLGGSSRLSEAGIEVFTLLSFDGH